MTQTVGLLWTSDQPDTETSTLKQWLIQEFCSVVVGWLQQIQLRTEGRENGDLGTVTS